eukprot:TRINITY_DN20567_c0_g1_i2.p2 TRINITY_DN20567_c0_g1~~TRINITY_DN20567_c0_g1_i2.p2  ORF type:complete len:123 (+),score=6.55 TRINITY_DN20567_c0_g1_i2:3-371(+)
MENDRLRGILTSHGIPDSEDFPSRVYSPNLGAMRPSQSPQDQLVVLQQSPQVIKSSELPMDWQQTEISLHNRSASAKLYQSMSVQPSPRIIRPKKMLSVNGPRLGRVKGAMTAIEVVPDAPS